MLYLVANLRGLYQEKTGNTLNLSTGSSDTRINVYAGTNENADLSNFANRPFVVTSIGENPDGPVAGSFNTVEGAFQAQKLFYANIDEDTKASLLASLEKATGAQAKAIGRKISNLNTKEWDEVSSSLMENLITKSFIQNPKAATRLLETGKATLTHIQDRGKWGTEFPRILMSVREKLGGSVTIDEAAKTLVEFRRSLSKEDAKRILDAVNNPAVSYTQLRDDVSAEERFNRISMISTMFSDIVDAVQEENPSVSRRDIVAGFTIDGQQVGGIAGIFNEIYDTLQSQYSDAVQEGDTETASKYQKIFDNWGALLSFAKIRIREAEDLKIGQDISFADDANPNNFIDNDRTEKFILD